MNNNWLLSEILKIRGPPRSSVNSSQLWAFGLLRSNVRSDEWLLSLGWTWNAFEWSMFVQQWWQCGCECFKIRLQCGDRNLGDIRRKNIITKIWYVDGFDWSYRFSNPWSSTGSWGKLTGIISLFRVFVDKIQSELLLYYLFSRYYLLFRWPEMFFIGATE